MWNNCFSIRTPLIKCRVKNQRYKGGTHSIEGEAISNASRDTGAPEHPCCMAEVSLGVSVFVLFCYRSCPNRISNVGPWRGNWNTRRTEDGRYFVIRNKLCRRRFLEDVIIIFQRRAGYSLILVRIKDVGFCFCLLILEFGLCEKSTKLYSYF